MEKSLKSENISSNFNEIRNKVIKDCNFHYDDEISYYLFRKIHEKYAPEVNEELFAEKIFDINSVDFYKLKYEDNYNAEILLEEPLPDENKILEIQNEIIEKYKIKKDDEMNFKVFLKFYRKFGGIMPEDMFAKQILEINERELVQIKKDPKLLIKFFSNKFTVKKFSQNRNNVMKKPRDIIFRIVNDCWYNEENVERVKEYIEKQKEYFAKNGHIERNNVAFLNKCVEFVQGGINEVSFLARVYCSLGKYEDAIYVINENKDNEAITDIDKEKLEFLINDIKIAINKKKAVELFRSGVTSIIDIKEQTGLNKKDILELIEKEKIRAKSFSDGHYED